MSKASAIRELALLRLVAQGLAGPRPDSPREAAERLLCLQAQDYWSGLASIAVRCGIGLSEVEEAFDQGTIVRAWPLRGTLHLLASEDLSWLRELLAERQLTGAARGRAEVGLDGPLIDRAARIATSTISERGPASRAELMSAWAAAGIDTSGQRTYRLIWHLAHMGTLVHGPTRDGQHLFALAEQWLPASPGIDRADALGLLARRYFTGHGPATAADLTRWANLTVADSKQAIAAARSTLATLSVGGVDYLLGSATQDTLADCRKDAGATLALPYFDELLLGYRDRDPTLPPERDSHVFANRNGVPAHTIIHKGQVIATWRRPEKGSRGPVEVMPLVPVAATVLERAASRALEISGRGPRA